MNDEQASELTEEKGLVILLGLLPEKSLLDEAHLAAALQVTPRTIRRMVGRSQLPPPVQLGGRSFWMVSTSSQFLAAAKETSKGCFGESNGSTCRCRAAQETTLKNG